MVTETLVKTTSAKPKRYTRRYKPYAGSKAIAKITKKRSNRVTGPFRQMLYNMPIKPYLNCKFDYGDIYTLTTGTSGIYGTEQTFRLNSLYDVDYTGSGHQPLFFDQIMAMYDQYKVNAVTIEITLTDPSADGVVFACQLQRWGETAAITNKSPYEVIEQPNSVVRYINQDKQVVKIRQYMPIHLIEGLTKLQFAANATDYCGKASDNPLRGPYLRMAIASLSGSSGVTLKVGFKITFHTRVYERKIVGLS